ncbi:MAG TPA: hypothetical protein VJ654_07645 [Noviherbaspirillum sp.]|nr:hypothetical protein [Noviherbaspirillum sp.]
MSIPDNQSDDEASSLTPSNSNDSEPNSMLEEDASDDTPSEVAMRISLLGKLIIPPPQP